MRYLINTFLNHVMEYLENWMPHPMLTAMRQSQCRKAADSSEPQLAAKLVRPWGATALAYNLSFLRKKFIMEAEQLNSLESLLKDLTARTIELRRYL